MWRRVHKVLAAGELAWRQSAPREVDIRISSAYPPHPRPLASGPFGTRCATVSTYPCHPPTLRHWTPLSPPPHNCTDRVRLPPTPPSPHLSPTSAAYLTRPRPSAAALSPLPLLVPNFFWPTFFSSPPNFFSERPTDRPTRATDAKHALRCGTLQLFWWPTFFWCNW